MGRETTAAFNNHLDQPITGVGYLVMIELPAPYEPLRWCDLQDFDYDTFLWSKVDFKITGLSFGTDKPLSPATLDVGNFDSAIGALMQQLNLADCPVTIYQFARGLNAAGDAPQLASMAIDGGEIGLNYCRLNLLPTRSRFSFVPRRKIDRAHGFKFGMPAGTVLAWGNEIFELKPED